MCDCINCDQEPIVIDDMENLLCQDCMETEIIEEGATYEDFEYIKEKVK